MCSESPSIIDPYEIIKKIYTDLEKKILGRKEKKFLAARNLILKQRVYLSYLASNYYLDKGYSIINKKIPILIKKEWIPSIPIDINNIKLKMQNGELESAEELLNDGIAFPLKIKYTDAIKRFYPEVDLHPDPTYTLSAINKIKDGYTIDCRMSNYYNYVDSCELLGYEFARCFLEKVKKEKIKNFQEEKINSIKFKLRDNINVFDFHNRSACIGINTLLIGVAEKKEKSIFYLHDRSKKKITEAVGTQHVVPAGTFQPWKEGDFHVKDDFDLYKNIMREYGEELLGEDKFEKQSKSLDSIFDCDILNKYNRLILEGLGKIYFLGIGLDCLTTKPEFLTAMVYKKEVIDDIFGGFDFTDNYEGEHVETFFRYDNIKKIVKSKKLLPAGAACLKLALDNFPFFLNCFAK